MRGARYKNKETVPDSEEMEVTYTPSITRVEIENEFDRELARRKKVTQEATFFFKRQNDPSHGVIVRRTASGHNKSPWLRTDAEMGYVRQPIKKAEIYHFTVSRRYTPY